MMMMMTTEMLSWRLSLGRKRWMPTTTVTVVQSCRFCVLSTCHLSVVAPFSSTHQPDFNNLQVVIVTACVPIENCYQEMWSRKPVHMSWTRTPAVHKGRSYSTRHRCRRRMLWIADHCSVPSRRTNPQNILRSLSCSCWEKFPTEKLEYWAKCRVPSRSWRSKRAMQFRWVRSFSLSKPIQYCDVVLPKPSFMRE